MQAGYYLINWRSEFEEAILLPIRHHFSSSVSPMHNTVAVCIYTTQSIHYSTQITCITTKISMHCATTWLASRPCLNFIFYFDICTFKIQYPYTTVKNLIRKRTFAAIKENSFLKWNPLKITTRKSCFNIGWEKIIRN